jgi:His/Glu/Gln/Arg/opine family amino acid ABC transporter permease subunit
LYALSAFAVNRVFAFIEKKKSRSPASSSPVARGDTDMGGLDLSFVNWEIISKFVVNGFWFSVQLTIVATLGGIFFGTLLALMRLSGKKVLMIPATFYVNGMRSIPLVMVILWFYLLVPTMIGRPIGASCRPPSPSSPLRRRTSARSCARASSPSRAARSMQARRWA